MDEMDLSKVCRLCLKGGDVLCPIFGNVQSNGTPSLPQRIMLCAQIKLSERDGLPNNVCTPCLTQVDRSYQFKLLCERSDMTLRSNMKAEPHSEDELLEENDQWDMTKFTPEVIIKEDNELSEDGNVNGNYGGNRDQAMDDYRHASLPLPPLYPLATMLVDGSPQGLSSLLPVSSNVHPSNMAEQYQERRPTYVLERVIHQQGNNNQQLHRSLRQELLQPPRSSTNQTRRCKTGDKLFKCRQCNKSYSFSSALSRHKAVHNTALRPHVCQICNKGFTQLDKLLRHQKTHSMDFFMACDLCHRPFKSFTAYQKHRLTSGCMMMNNGQVMQQQRNSREQSEDNMTSQEERGLPESEKSPTDEAMGDDNAPQQSDSSSPGDTLTSGDQQSQNSSGRNSGKGKPEFQCKVCEKLFATRGSLEVHSTIHSGLRPFSCSACDKAFRHKVNLMEHFQRKHSLVRPYICDVCAARFVTKQELVRHYRKHIGD